MISKFAIALMITSASLTAFGQAKSDLIVSALAVEPDPGGRFIARVSVTVLNACRGVATAQSFVLVTFKEHEHAGAKSIYFVGSKVKTLKGGESQTLMFDTSATGKQIELTRHGVAEVDPYRKVAEVSEDNNWRTLNPGAAGVSQCRAEK